MARYTGPVCKLCRREGQKLFLKGQKCYTEKCPVERRAYPPGQHGPAQARRRKQSDYANQLREKQKVKRTYGLHEKQFRSLFETALISRASPVRTCIVGSRVAPRQHRLPDGLRRQPECRRVSWSGTGTSR